MAGNVATSQLTAAHIERALPDDDPDLRRLLRDNPMDGRIRLSLEREPNFFHATSIEGDRHDTLVARDLATGQIIAMGSRSVRDAFVNGQVVRLGYLSQLRIDRAYRNRTRQLLRGGFAFFHQMRRPDETAFDITTVVADNEVARRLLEARLPGLPIYQPIEKFVTLVLPLRRLHKHGPKLRIERGSPSRLPAMVDCLQRNAQRYQFAPRWTAESLLGTECARGLRLNDFRLVVDGERVLGCLACWDQRTFKQAVVRGYDKTLARWRPLLNLAGPLFGVPRLPDIGETLAMATLSHLAIDNDDPCIFSCLLASTLAQARGRYDHFMIGLAARHPLVEWIQRRYRCREYASMIYLVHWDDVARASTDARIPHLELGVL